MSRICITKHGIEVIVKHRSHDEIIREIINLFLNASNNTLMIGVRSTDYEMMVTIERKQDRV